MTAPPHDPTPGALIAIDGLRNIRDLGGWATPTGVVRHGRLFRSDRLDELTPASHRALDALGISTVVDFRYESERDEAPSRLWSSVTNHVEIPMAPKDRLPGSFVERVQRGEFDNLTDATITEMYQVLLKVHRPGFVEAISQMVSGGPALFHCSAGKDRTGIMAMLLLSVLGVAEEDIVAEFDLTNTYRTESRMEEMAEVFAKIDLDVEDFRPIMSAPVPAMIGALAWIRAEHGTAEAYLVDGGLDQATIERMRSELVAEA